jgi:hypothetical protein
MKLASRMTGSLGVFLSGLLHVALVAIKNSQVVELSAGTVLSFFVSACISARS